MFTLMVYDIGWRLIGHNDDKKPLVKLARTYLGNDVVAIVFDETGEAVSYLGAGPSRVHGVLWVLCHGNVHLAPVCGGDKCICRAKSPLWKDFGV